MGGIWINTDKRRGRARQGKDPDKDKILKAAPDASSQLCSDGLEPPPAT